MKLLALSLVMLLGCKGKDKECPPVPPPPAPGVDPLLVDALCALSLTPPGPGTGHTSAGVVTNGKLRRPWFSRDYDARFVDLATLEKDLFLLKSLTTNGWKGMMPSGFCTGTGPVLVSIILYNATEAGKPGAWILGGDLTKPEKVFVESATVDSRAFVKASVAPVIALLGPGTQLEQLPESTSSRTSGVDGSWDDAFKP